MENTKVLEFYNNFDKRLIDNFLNGNQRIQAALNFVLNRIPEDVKFILDIGCGIGWSSYELAINFPNATVLGIDLSDNLLNIADQLFQAPNLKFAKADLTSNDLQFIKNKIDVVVLIDVYEHIPNSVRNNFNTNLANLLSDKASILLTCPTPSHLDYLKRNKPTEIQPVDEDITIDVLQKLSLEIEGEIVYYNKVKVWRSNDYFHCGISKEYKYDTGLHVTCGKKYLPNHMRLDIIKRSSLYSLFKSKIDSINLDKKEIWHMKMIKKITSNF